MTTNIGLLPMYLPGDLVHILDPIFCNIPIEERVKSYSMEELLKMQSEQPDNSYMRQQMDKIIIIKKEQLCNS